MGSDESKINKYIIDLLEERTILIDMVEELVIQSCKTKHGDIDSMHISTYSDAIRLLASYGRVKIISDSGRRVIAKLSEKQNNE